MVVNFAIENCKFVYLLQEQIGSVSLRKQELTGYVGIRLHFYSAAVFVLGFLIKRQKDVAEMHNIKKKNAGGKERFQSVRHPLHRRLKGQT